MRLQQQATEGADQKDCIEKLSLQLKTTLSELEDRKINLKSSNRVSCPDTETDGETSPNFYKKLNKALRLEDELHRKVDELRATVENLQRQIQQLQQLLVLGIAVQRSVVDINVKNTVLRYIIH
ncbi:unnamed protein product [Albugo candida]|uniref:Uncharacterized protein n=1 Tax=Albugo candida TaxID=65357 RepID=A0A024FY79_9STRA|nr:unnamed protein product [Albugo candida]|eukprot:CCI11619.1 unnamed protein product [Albugo candida]